MINRGEGLSDRARRPVGLRRNKMISLAQKIVFIEAANAFIATRS
jgi:hypothetical protein